jgi:hypothetical protein
MLYSHLALDFRRWTKEIALMVAKDEVLACYRFLLDREPENNEVVDAKCMALSLKDVVRDIVTGAEFLENHKVAIAARLLAKG